jgi:predicted DNA-binding transcriptional regulator AlpA
MENTTDGDVDQRDVGSDARHEKSLTSGAGKGTSPLLLTARQAAELCGKSLRTWRSWDAAGWIPRPVRIGRSTLWRLDELREWVAAGCPRRAEWEALR